MTSLLLAQAAHDTTANWQVVQTLGILAALAANLVLVAGKWGSKANERQIEPTSLGAITTELRGQTSTLNNINREVGEVRTKVEALEHSVDGFHQRISGVSRELAATSARVDGLEKREGHS